MLVKLCPLVIVIGVVLWADAGCAKDLQKPQMIFINPGFAGDNYSGPFWRDVSAYMQAAADDLNIDLSIRYAKRDHFLMVELAAKAIEEKPDYLILVNEKGVMKSSMDAADKAGVQTFLLLNGLNKQEKVAGYKYYLGSLSPDNKKAGYQLASLLIAKGAELELGRKLNLFALLGDYSSQASLDRQSGLEQALAAYSQQVELVDAVVAQWSEEKSYRLSKAYLSRLKNIDLIWAANDPMAEGAVKAAREKGRIPGKNLIAGGMNWDPQDKTEQPQLLSMGGHMVLGGFALVLLHDHFLGHNTQRQEIVLDIFAVNGNQTSARLIQLLDDEQLDRLNFIKFSAGYKSTPLAMKLENLLVSMND